MYSLCSSCLLTRIILHKYSMSYMAILNDKHRMRMGQPMKENWLVNGEMPVHTLLQIHGRIESSGINKSFYCISHYNSSTFTMRLVTSAWLKHSRFLTKSDLLERSTGLTWRKGMENPLCVLVDYFSNSSLIDFYECEQVSLSLLKELHLKRL